MEIVFNEDELRHYMRTAVSVSNDSPVLLDRFLDDAIECDVDAVSDGDRVVIGGIMQHIEQAGVHSGDSACSLPPYNLPKEIQDVLREQSVQMARELGVVGLMNVQFAVKDGTVYVLEVNPRASRTVPYVSKCIGTSLAKIAARCMAGMSLEKQAFTREVVPPYFSVKEAVFPFAKFPGVDPILGPEMKSTGEVMGVGKTFGEAFGKATLGAGERIPAGGLCFLSVRDADKAMAIQIARDLVDLGFELIATRGTARNLVDAGIKVEIVNKVMEGRPHVVDMLKNGEISLIINTTEGKQSTADSFTIRRTALQKKVFYTTTIAAASAVVEALRNRNASDVRRLQSLHEALVAGGLTS